MFDRGDIRAAVEAGAMSDEAGKRFEAFLRARNDPDRMLDPENLRFLTNFNDVFLAIGMLILIVGVGTASVLMLGERVEDAPRLAALAPVPVLGVSWLLAEYFAGRRRLLLPSMVLAVAICLSAAVIASVLAVPEDVETRFDGNPLQALSTVGAIGLAASAVAAIAVHLRFRLAFALLLFALSVAGIFYVLIAGNGQDRLVIGGLASLVAGIVTLGVAIWFDAQDPSRSTLTSDRAFWLHLAAAPQIILGVRGLVLGSGFTPAGVTDAAAMLAVLVAFGLLSLALNRRALIVSGLISFSTAVGTLLDQVSGGNEMTTGVLTLLVVGGSIVLLGGGWRTARRVLLGSSPRDGVFGRIFPPEPA